MEPATTTTKHVSPHKKTVTSLRKMVKGARKAMEQRPDKKTCKSTGSDDNSPETFAKKPAPSSIRKDACANQPVQQRSKSSDADFHNVYEVGQHRHRRLQDTALSQRKNSLEKLRGSHTYKLGRDFTHYAAGRDDGQEDDEVSLGSVETAIPPVHVTWTNPGTQSSWGTFGNSAGSTTFSFNLQKPSNPGDKQSSWGTLGNSAGSVTLNSNPHHYGHKQSPWRILGNTCDLGTSPKCVSVLQNPESFNNSGNLNSSMAGSSWGTLEASGGSATFFNFLPSLTLGTRGNFNASESSFSADVVK